MRLTRTPAGQEAYAILDWVFGDPPGRAAEGQQRLARLAGSVTGVAGQAEIGDVATMLARLRPPGEARRYDPTEARDPHGKWAKTGGALSEAAKGLEPGPASGPRGAITPEQKKLAALVDQGADQRFDLQPEAGVQGETSFVRFKDGSPGVHQTYGWGGMPSSMSDSSYLSYLVADAIGNTGAPAVVRGDRQEEIWQQMAPGLVGYKWQQKYHPREWGDTGYGPVAAFRSPRALRIGLLDHLIANPDRNDGNYLHEDNDSPDGWTPIDHSSGFTGNFAGGPFAKSLQQAIKRAGPPIDTPAGHFQVIGDIDAIGQRLQALEPAFAEAGRSVWFAQMMARYQVVASWVKTGKIDQADYANAGVAGALADFDRRRGAAARRWTRFGLAERQEARRFDPAELRDPHPGMNRDVVEAFLGMPIAEAAGKGMLSPASVQRFDPRELRVTGGPHGGEWTKTPGAGLAQAAASVAPPPRAPLSNRRVTMEGAPAALMAKLNAKLTTAQYWKPGSKLEGQLKRPALPPYDQVVANARDEILRTIRDGNTLEEGKAWYPHEHDLAVQRAAQYGVSPEQAAGVLAATSPRTHYIVNEHVTAEILDAVPRFKGAAAMERKGGRGLKPFAKGGIMDQFRIDGVDIAVGKDIDKSLGGMKVRSFFNNIMWPGKTDDVTVDVWMADVLQSSGLTREQAQGLLAEGGAGSQIGYMAISDATRQAARELGVAPDEAQAAFWIAQQRKMGFHVRLGEEWAQVRRTDAATAGALDLLSDDEWDAELILQWLAARDQPVILDLGPPYSAKPNLDLAADNQVAWDLVRADPRFARLGLTFGDAQLEARRRPEAQRAFNPAEKRDPHGRWTRGGGLAAAAREAPKLKVGDKVQAGPYVGTVEHVFPGGQMRVHRPGVSSKVYDPSELKPLGKLQAAGLRGRGPVAVPKTDPVAGRVAASMPHDQFGTVTGRELEAAFPRIAREPDRFYEKRLRALVGQHRQRVFDAIMKVRRQGKGRKVKAKPPAPWGNVPELRHVAEDQVSLAKRERGPGDPPVLSTDQLLAKFPPRPGESPSSYDMRLAFLPFSSLLGSPARGGFVPAAPPKASPGHAEVARQVADRLQRDHPSEYGMPEGPEILHLWPPRTGENAADYGRRLAPVRLPDVFKARQAQLGIDLPGRTTAAAAAVANTRGSRTAWADMARDVQDRLAWETTGSGMPDANEILALHPPTADEDPYTWRDRMLDIPHSQWKRERAGAFGQPRPARGSEMAGQTLQVAGTDLSPAQQDLAHHLESGVQNSREPDSGEGAQSHTVLLGLNDGSAAVSKQFLEGWHPENMADVEYLAGQVAEAIGNTGNPVVVRSTDPAQVFMTMNPGTIGANYSGDPFNLFRSARGEHIGLLDRLTGNLDRHDANYMVARDEQGRGVPSAIDNSSAFGAFNSFSGGDREDGMGSPFWEGVTHQVRVGQSSLTKSEMRGIGLRLRALKPVFDKAGRSEWYKEMMVRWAAAQKDILGGGERTTAPPAGDSGVSPSWEKAMSDFRGLIGDIQAGKF